ncbi:MAG: DUF72 domain-containing protein [Thermodesulfobacteriota bacterium]
MTGEDKVKVGCCGFAGRQAEYFRLFRVIEIQQTFYQLPLLGTATKWREAAPPGFEFTIKAWQLITHEPSSPTYRRLKERPAPGEIGRYGGFRGTPEVMEAWEKTAAFARALGSAWIVFQCPRSFTPAPDHVKRMKRFFRGIDRAGFRFAWEPRGEWAEDLVLDLCRDLDLTHAVDPFKNRPLYGDTLYLRLHGVRGYTYDYRYSDEELDRIAGWAGERPSYVMFNNSNMKEDALRFIERVIS